MFGLQGVQTQSVPVEPFMILFFQKFKKIFISPFVCPSVYSFIHYFFLSFIHRPFLHRYYNIRPACNGSFHFPSQAAKSSPPVRPSRCLHFITQTPYRLNIQKKALKHFKNIVTELPLFNSPVKKTINISSKLSYLTHTSTEVTVFLCGKITW